MNFIQNDAIKRVSYYTVTSGFINDVLDGYGDSNFTTLRITGASLGGGLAIISGAQTGAAAVAISGLGAELSRHTLNPPVTLAQINENVFNFIPDRDYIARSKRMKGGACLVIKLVCLGVFADRLHRLLSHFVFFSFFLRCSWRPSSSAPGGAMPSVYEQSIWLSLNVALHL